MPEVSASFNVTHVVPFNMHGLQPNECLSCRQNLPYVDQFGGQQGIGQPSATLLTQIIYIRFKGDDCKLATARCFTSKTCLSPWNGGYSPRIPKKILAFFRTIFVRFSSDD